MTRTFRSLGDRMLTRLLPGAAAKACHCCWISNQCWRNTATGCTGCNFGGPTCGCGSSGGQEHICGPC
jgi:hypothetical protein